MNVAQVVHNALVLYSAHAFNSAQCTYSVQCMCTERYTVDVQCKMLGHSTEYTVCAQKGARVNEITVKTIVAQLGPLTSYTLSTLTLAFSVHLMVCTVNALVHAIHL